jgi:myo-inositol-1(or 4)-monophosphatase
MSERRDQGKARLRAVLFECLREAGKILMKHYGRLRRIEHKGEIDLVTVADRESERAIKRILRRAFPEHGVLAEESGLAALAGRGRGQRQTAQYLWIVDPLDGTTNYSHTFPAFSVSIALQAGGEIVLGGVYAPFQDEMFWAEKGKGARLNGRRIRVSRTPRLSESLVVTGFPYDRRKNVKRYLRYVEEFLLASHGVLRVGSAALDLCSVACGRLDGFWEEKLFPWDTAAGKLIVEEAGGKITDFKGNTFSPYGKEIVASNGVIHEEMLRVIRGVGLAPTLSGG